LGITSEAEFAEVWLHEDRPLGELQSALEENAPPGVAFLAVEVVEEGTPKLPNLVQSAEYLVTLPTPPPDLETRVENLLAAQTILRHRRDKTYDLRPLIDALDIRSNTEAGKTELSVRLSNRPNATGRPDEVLGALEIPIEEAQIHRTRLILK
jgi:radical SAM-linked protein